MDANSRFSLKGKTALVTGSSRGIGRAIALGLAEAGASVAVHATASKEKLAEIEAEIRALGCDTTSVLADLAEADSPRRLFEEVTRAFGPLDILICNASLQIPEDWREISPEHLEQQMNINFRSTFALFQLAVPPMMSRGWGRVLTLGSVQELRPHPQMMIYAASKNAQTALVRNLAAQAAPCGVTLNNLAPGVIGTDRSLSRLADKAYEEKVLAKIPAGKIGTPDDCVGAALLLCGDAGRYITGQSLVVDGGMSL